MHAPLIKNVDLGALKSIYLILLGGLFPLLLCSQVSENVFSPKFTNLTIEDGLPSNTIFHVYCDKKGVIWIATDNGVCRMNGNSIKTYTKKDGLTDNVIFKFYEDAKGRIWCSTSNHKLCYFLNDTIHPYKYNSIIKENVSDNVINWGLIVDEKDNVHLGYNYTGYYKIDAKGRIEHYGTKVNNYDSLKGIYVKPIGNEIITFHYNVGGLNPNPAKLSRLVQLNKNNATVDKKYEIPFDPKHYIKGVQYAVMVKEPGYALTKGPIIYLVENENLEVLDTLQSGAIYITKIEDNLWVGTRQKGIFRYDMSSTKREKESFLNGYSITSTCKDLEGGYWFSSLEKGLFYTPNLNVMTYTNSLNNANALSLLVLNNNEVLIGYDNGLIQKLNTENELTTYHFKFQEPNNSIFEIKRKENQFYCSAPESFIFSFESKNRIKKLNHAFKKIMPLEDDVFYGFTPSMILFRDKNSTHKIRHKLRINTIETNRNKMFLGCSSGLWTLEGVRLSKLDMGAVENNLDIIDLKRFGTIKYFISSDGYLNKYNQPNNLQRYRFKDSKNELIERFRALSINANGEVWLSHPKGLIKTNAKNPNQYFNLTSSDGFPNSMVIDIQPKDNYTWLLTAKGVTYIKKHEPIKFQKFIMKEILINGTKYKLSDKLILPYDLNQIEFKYFMQSYKNSSSIVFKYFMENEDKDTIITQNNSIRYSSLAPGIYNFTIMGSTDGINFSTPNYISIKISPQFWKTWWFILLEIMMLIGVFIISLKYRTKRISNKNDLKLQLIELRSKALRAQMNPHFTFNALNSIQHLISSEKNKQAAVYLAEFSSLMRKTLDASANDSHTLRDEMDIVEIYLSMEKLRFKELINYNLKVDDKLNLNSIMIPPMIIQPLVENSIIHGLLKKDDDGLIDIILSVDENEFLSIIVKDDGLGFDISNKKTNANSKGTSIIQERLMLNDKDNSLIIKSTPGEGTISEIKFKIK